MASDGPTPPPCDPEIFAHGESVAALDASSNAAERWVRTVAEKASARVDWHYSGGIAHVLHLGDSESRARVEAAIDELAPTLDGTIMRRYSPDEAGLYRQGVSDNTQEPGAVVREIDGQLVLDDPVAAGVIRALSKQNCRGTLELNADRVTHFKQRVGELNRSATDTVIVLMNVDDINGGPLAYALMPDYNWQEIRDLDEVPFARGLAEREGMQEALALFDQEAATKLREMTELAVVVVDYGVAEVFPA